MDNVFNRNYNEIMNEGIKTKALRNLAIAGVLGANLISNNIEKGPEVTSNVANSQEMPYYEIDAEEPQKKKVDSIVNKIIPQSTFINVEKIIKIESSGNPKAKSHKGARGLMQIMPKTWDEVVRNMGENWDYDRYVENPEINKKVGSYYINTMIPKYLKSYRLPDTIETRLAAYNAGIKTVRNLYMKYSDNWKDHLPLETKNYIKKYNGLK